MWKGRYVRGVSWTGEAVLRKKIESLRSCRGRVSAARLGMT